MVHSSKHVAIKDSDVSYSVKLEGGVGTGAIGGVFTHALDYVLMPGRSNTQITQKWAARKNYSCAYNIV